MTDTHTEEQPRQELAVVERPRPAIVAGASVSGLVPQSLDEAYRLAQWCAKSNLTPKGIDTPEKCLYVIMAGADLRMAPTQALQSFALINGRLSLWGDSIPALLLSNGFRLKEWTENSDSAYPDNMVAKCEITRPDGQVFEGEFSVADAKEAKLWTKEGPWQTARKRMLKMRARAFTARDGAADLLRGLYIAEEAQDIPPPLPDDQIGKTGMVERLAARAQPVDQAGFNVNNMADELKTEGPKVGEQNPKFGAHAEGGDVIIEGPAPAGVTYFWSESADLSDAGRRQTFKDGVPFGRPKAASSDIPVYSEHAPLIEEPKPPQSDAPVADTKLQTDEVAKPASPTGSATAPIIDGGGALTTAEVADMPAKGENYLIADDEPNGMGQIPMYRDGKLVGYATPEGARATSMKTYRGHLGGEVRPTETVSAQAAEAEPDTLESATLASTGSAAEGSGQEAWNPDDDEPDMDDLPGADDEEVEIDDGPVVPEAFHQFQQKLHTLDSWLTIKAALSSLRKSDDWRADERGRFRVPARRMAFELVEALRHDRRDPVDPRVAPDYFAAWVEFAPVGELQGVWQRLITSKAYQGLKDEQKDSLADAFEANRVREA